MGRLICGYVLPQPQWLDESGSQDDAIIKGNRSFIVAQGKRCGGAYLVEHPEAQSELEVKFGADCIMSTRARGVCFLGRQAGE